MTLDDYILAHTEPEPDYLYRLWRATNIHTIHGRMASGHLQGRLLKMLVQMIVRHGEDIIYRDLETDDGNTINLNVAQYIAYDLGQDALSFSNPLFNRILDEAVLHSADEGFKAESFFLNHEDVEISKIANMLSVDQVQLSKSLQLSKDDDGLREQVIHLILDFRMDYVEEHLKELKAKFRNTADVTEQMNIMQEIKDMQEIRNALAKRLGKNIVNI